MRLFSSAVREPEWAAEAQLVCDEMARRARHNVELIVGRLSDDGYRFPTNDGDRMPVPPAHADWLVRRFGAVPMTLLSWTRIVGDVWLVGTHPEWPASAAADPLVVEVAGTRDPEVPIREYFDDEWSGAGGFPWPVGERDRPAVRHRLAKDLLPL
jgi:hypothetical protein